MKKEQKNEVIEVLKNTFAQYSNFYITNTESLTVEQINTLRKVCFEKKVEMKVAKNTLIKKALEQINKEKYSSTFEALNGVTALMFSNNPKEPALIISEFREKNKKAKEKPVLKAAFIDGDAFIGDNQLSVLKALKSKQDLIGEIIGLLQSPAQNVISGLQSAKSTIGGLLKTLEERAAQ